jgi:hypothetical protein
MPIFGRVFAAEHLPSTEPPFGSPQMTSRLRQPPTGSMQATFGE